jgi:hypothetical protein
MSHFGVARAAWRLVGFAVVGCFLLGALDGGRAFAKEFDPAAHTDPINLTAQAREGRELFYIQDYDGALRVFEALQKANPQNPMAVDYVQMTLIIRELYRQDLLDTT